MAKPRLTSHFPTSVLRYKTASPNAPRPKVRTLVYGSSDALPSVNDSSAIIKTEGNNHTKQRDLNVTCIDHGHRLPRDFSRAYSFFEILPTETHSASEWMDNVLIYNAKKWSPTTEKKRSLFPREETRNHVYASAATKYRPADGDAYVNDLSADFIWKDTIFSLHNVLLKASPPQDGGWTGSGAANDKSYRGGSESVNYTTGKKRGLWGSVFISQIYF